VTQYVLVDRDGVQGDGAIGIRAEQGHVVIDDVASVNLWRVRGIEIRGEAERLMAGGETVIPGFDPAMFRITQRRIVSWGLNPEAQAWIPTGRSVNKPR
jgi:hypothetical protein